MMEKIVKAFAVFVTYLFIAMPVSNAATINVIPPVGPTQYAELDYSDYVSISITPNKNANHDTEIIVKNATSDYKLKNVFIYRCRDKEPDECIQGSEIDEFTGNVENLYDWCELGDRCDFSPDQVANILILSRISDGAGKEFWAGAWYRIERPSGWTFYLYPDGEPQYSNVDVNVKESGYVDEVLNYVDIYKMIPVYSLWTESVTFHLGNALFHLSSNMSTIISKDFDSDEISGSSITSAAIDDDYNFLLPDTGASILSPLTLFRNAAYTCRNGVCESDLGETSSNCCYDCGCGSGEYCDGGVSCVPKSYVSLELYGSANLKISDCTKDNDITVQVRVKNPPTGMVLESLKYRLDAYGEKISGTCKNVEVSGNVYSCTLTVPGDPECAGSTFSLEPNYIDMRIRFPNGAETDYMDLTSPDLGEIVAGSYVCGNNVCESDLGETSSNCCYDCGCPEGRYCSTDTGDPSTGICRPDLINDYLKVGHYNKTDAFYTHNPSGDSIEFSMWVENAPVKFSAVNPTCSIECSDCTASCGIVCEETQSDDPDIKYNSTCELTFRILNYNHERDYLLRPRVSLLVNYYNASELKTTTLTRWIKNINIGKNFCGDGECDTSLGETSSNCCYDCGCPAGEYCDTRYRTGPSEEDMGCRPGNEISLETDVSGTEFVDSWPDDPHIITVEGTVENAPSSLEIDTSCEFANNEYDFLPCDADCRKLGRDPYTFECEIAVPSFNPASVYFLEKYGDIYDYSARELSFSGNSVTFNLVYNNGTRQESISHTDEIDDVKIRVIAHSDDNKCNDGRFSDTCEREDSDGNCLQYYRYIDLDEVSFKEDCENGDEYCLVDCRACGCPEVTDSEGNPVYYCNFAPAQPPFECKRHDDIQLIIDRAEMKCYIQPGGNCTLGYDGDEYGSSQGSMRFHIKNAPPDLSTTSYPPGSREIANPDFVDPDETDNFGRPWSYGCYKDEEVESDENRLLSYSCNIRLDDIYPGVYNNSEGCSDSRIDLATGMENCAAEDVNTDTCIITKDYLFSGNYCPTVTLSGVTTWSAQLDFYDSKNEGRDTCTVRFTNIMNECLVDGQPSGDCEEGMDYDFVEEGIYYDCYILGRGYLENVMDEETTYKDISIKLNAFYGGEGQGGTLRGNGVVKISASKSQLLQSLEDQKNILESKRDYINGIIKTVGAIIGAGFIFCTIASIFDWGFAPTCWNVLLCATGSLIPALPPLATFSKQLKDQIENYDAQITQGTVNQYSSYNEQTGESVDALISSLALVLIGAVFCGPLFGWTEGLTFMGFVKAVSAPLAISGSTVGTATFIMNG